MLQRTKEFRRAQREAHIIRKENIIRKHHADSLPHFVESCRELEEIRKKWRREHPDIKDKYNPVHQYGNSYDYWYVKYRGMLNKGKIHCSCPICRFSGNTMQDRKRAAAMLYDLMEADVIESATAERLKKDVRDAR